MEYIRAAIDDKVFSFIEKHEFGRTDFPQVGLNHYRLSRDITQIFLHEAYLRTEEIERAVVELTRLITRDGTGRLNAVDETVWITEDCYG